MEKWVFMNEYSWAYFHTNTLKQYPTPASRLIWAKRDRYIFEALDIDLVMMIYNNNCISIIEGGWHYHFKMMHADGVARHTFINLICFNGIFPLRVLVVGRKLIIHKKWLFLLLFLSQKTQSLIILQHHHKYSNTNILLPSGNFSLVMKWVLLKGTFH